MKRLFNLTTTQKVWRSFPHGTHNDTIAEAGYFDAIHEFMHAVKTNRVERMLTRKNFDEDSDENEKLKK
jgi:hypothetical protein